MQQRIGLGRNRKEKDRDDKLSKEVLGMISLGQISKAMKRVLSHGVANMNNPGIRAQIERNFH